ncbi:MAG: hypothetical protein EPO12_12400 [Aquabacterium sp.]|nr:MAG: hypothetical protein EPO12_12400 [Aquabacterium sp.]
MRNITADLTPQQVDHILADLLADAACEVIELPELVIEKTKGTEAHSVVRALCARLVAVGSLLLELSEGADASDLASMCSVLCRDLDELVERARHA